MGTVCWDPLDGSSIVDNNWAVGTMIGICGSKSGTGEDGLIGATGRDQKTSLVALYGPRTTVLVALDDGVYEFSYGCTPEGCQQNHHQRRLQDFRTSEYACVEGVDRLQKAYR